MRSSRDVIQLIVIRLITLRPQLATLSDDQDKVRMLSKVCQSCQSCQPAKHSHDTLFLGSEAFITLVDGISAHLLYPDLLGAPPPPFGETLRFTVRYAEFHHTRLEGRRADAAGELTELFSSDLVPRSWWGLLLVDAAGLLSDGTFLEPLNP